ALQRGGSRQDRVVRRTATAHPGNDGPKPRGDAAPGKLYTHRRRRALDSMAGLYGTVDALARQIEAPRKGDAILLRGAPLRRAVENREDRPPWRHVSGHRGHVGGP